MIRLLKVLAIVVASAVTGVVILYFVVTSALSYQASQTRKDLMQTVARELPAGASKEQITEFLSRHTSGFGLDERRNQYAGFIPQTKWDHFWFERQVQILFKLNPDGTLKNAEVWVFYTFL